jgi:hypothetical protein
VLGGAAGDEAALQVRALVCRELKQPSKALLMLITPLQLLQKRAQGLLSCAMEGLGSATAENVSALCFSCSAHA